MNENLTIAEIAPASPTAAAARVIRIAIGVIAILLVVTLWLGLLWFCKWFSAAGPSTGSGDHISHG